MLSVGAAGSCFWLSDVDCNGAILGGDGMGQAWGSVGSVGASRTPWG